MRPVRCVAGLGKQAKSVPLNTLDALLPSILDKALGQEAIGSHLSAFSFRRNGEGVTPSGSPVIRGRGGGQTRERPATRTCLCDLCGSA
jgi:hypothetical protein